MFAHATKPSPLQVLDGLGQSVARVTATLAAAWEANRVYNCLSSLSPSQLAARGLTHEDIGRATLRVLNGDKL